VSEFILEKEEDTLNFCLNMATSTYPSAPSANDHFTSSDFQPMALFKNYIKQSKYFNDIGYILTGIKGLKCNPGKM
jgi:hypothetical protein